MTTKLYKQIVNGGKSKLESIKADLFLILAMLADEKIDVLDIKILMLKVDNLSITESEIADKIKANRSTVHYRLDRIKQFFSEILTEKT